MILAWASPFKGVTLAYHNKRVYKPKKYVYFFKVSFKTVNMLNLKKSHRGRILVT